MALDMRTIKFKIEGLPDGHSGWVKARSDCSPNPFFVNLDRQSLMCVRFDDKFVETTVDGIDLKIEIIDFNAWRTAREI